MPRQEFLPSKNSRMLGTHGTMLNSPNVLTYTYCRISAPQPSPEINYSTLPRLTHGRAVAGIYELVFMIATYCDWITLLQLSNCNKNFRSIIQQFMLQQIRSFLGPYLGIEHLPRFFELLAESNAAVTGGLIHAMLSSSSESIYYTIKPRQLDLVVPHNGGRGMSAWTRFLATLEFNFLYDTVSSVTYKHLSKRTVTMARNVSSSITSDEALYHLPLSPLCREMDSVYV